METLEALTGQVLPGDIAYQVRRWWKELNKAGTEAKKELKVILDDCADKTEEGNLQPDEHTGIKIKEAKLPEYTERFQKFLDTEVDIPCQPLHVRDLKHASLAASQIETLEPILTEVVLASAPRLV